MVNKRLVQITTMVNSGSVGRIAEEIGQLAMSKGWESYIAYGRGDRPSDSKLIKVGTLNDVRMHGIQTRLFDTHGFGSRRATLRLIEQLKEIKPDVIHLHNIHGYYINVEVLFNYFASTDTPVVWTMHDCWALTGHCFHFENIGCEKWLNGCYSCPSTKTYPGSILLDNSKNNYKRKKELFNSAKNLTIVPVCGWLEGIVKRSYLSQKRTHVIYNGINTEIFTPRANSEELRRKMGLEGKFVMLAVSSVWYATKGYDDIIEMSGKLSDDEKIIIVGVTAKQAAQLPKNIIAIQRTENIDELADLYSMADVLINPTYQDTLPTIDIESLACGTPVVTYRTGGSADIVTPETGIVVPCGDKKAMFDAVREVKTKGKENYFAACRKRAIEHFKKEERFADYIKLYDELTK